MSRNSSIGHKLASNKKLLENHEFINVDIAAKEIDWKNIKKVILN